MLQTTTFTLHNTVAGFCYTDSDAADQKRNIGVIQNAGMLFADAGFGEMERVKMGPIVRFWESQANPESVFGQFGLKPMHALQKQHPGLALLSLSDAAQRVSAASRARLCKGPERIDLDYYDDALETLPPQRFTIKPDWSAFHFMEHITGEFVRWFVRLGRGSGSTYWMLVEACDADMGAIVNMCREAAKGVQA